MVTIDWTDVGAARFCTTVELTSDDPVHFPETGLYRLFCYYAVGHLQKQGLAEAARCLADLVETQKLRLETPPKAVAEPKRIAVKPYIKSVPKQPFLISE